MQRKRWRLRGARPATCLLSSAPLATRRRELPPTEVLVSRQLPPPVLAAAVGAACASASPCARSASGQWGYWGHGSPIAVDGGRPSLLPSDRGLVVLARAATPLPFLPALRSFPLAVLPTDPPTVRPASSARACVEEGRPGAVGRYCGKRRRLTRLLRLPLWFGGSGSDPVSVGRVT